MSISDADIAFARELFEGVGAITTRKMMGGLCLYADGTIFAIVHSDGKIYLKAKGEMIARLEAMGSTRWTYARDGKKEVGMPYWTLPDSALDDADLALDLARATLVELEG